MPRRLSGSTRMRPAAPHRERRFHGLRVRIVTTSPALEAAILREFPGEDLAGPESPERGTVEIRADTEDAGGVVPEAPRPLHSGALGLAYLVAHDRVWLETRAGSRACIDLAARTAVLQVASVPTAGIEVETAAILGVGLPYLYRELGLQPVHSAGVVAGGTPVLLAGVSGSGKSTTAAWLARCGFRFLSDDLVLLDTTAGTLTIRGLPRSPRLDAAARKRLEALPAAGGSDPGELEGEPSSAQPPVLLLFPRVEGGEGGEGGDGGDGCVLQPLSRPEALDGLIRCSLLLGEKEATGKHLAGLATLVSRATAFRLRLGGAMEALPEMIRAHLAPREEGSE